MHNTRIMVRDGILIVLAWTGAGLDGVDEEGGAVEGGGEAGG